VRFHLDREHEQDNAQKGKKASGSKTKKTKDPEVKEETPITEG
jgi:general stress protein YciG